MIEAVRSFLGMGWLQSMADWANGLGWIQIDANPWGEEVMIGMTWNVTWVVVALGAAFIVGHAIFANKKDVVVGEVDPAKAAAVPAEVTRHGMSARISHWILAAAVFVLLITAFVPMLGLQFAWVTVHWVAGIVLAVYVVYHIVDTLVRGSWGRQSMLWIGPKEIALSVRRLGNFFKREADPANRTGKWGIENRIFHHLTALASVAVVVTGILMMARVDTWFWAADPYRFDFTDSEWGMVFVIHGASSVAFIGLLMAHIYFAVRPDKFYLTKSMVTGTIARDEYLGHYDPDQWPAEGPNGSASPVGPAQQPAGAGASGAPMDRPRE